MEQIEYITGNEETLQHLTKVAAWRPFDERAVLFCNVLSAELMKTIEIQKYPDLLTLAFWLRKANIQKIKEEYGDISDRLGRGMAFHIAPGNVPLSFAYSMATGLLTGNANVIRLPSRKFEQADIFCRILNEVLEKSEDIPERVCLIKYSHNKEITDAISAKCHCRIIWGGDRTVDIIRESKIPPRASEITFANRFSICLIDSDKYLTEYDPKKTAHQFFIDTYLTDQNACSSPRIIFWMGDQREKAKDVFWEALYNEISDYPLADVTTVEKLLTFCKFAAENPCKMTIGRDCRLMRIAPEELNLNVLKNIGNSGFFYEYDISDINEILPFCTWELQTISFLGIEENTLRELILLNAPDGVDRIVPVGHTMDFSLIWDGRDIVRELTRKVSFR